jgi:hypothetical protein
MACAELEFLSFRGAGFCSAGVSPAVCRREAGSKKLPAGRGRYETLRSTRLSIQLLESP